MKREMLSGYLQEIEGARLAFPQMEIYSGLEIDYVPGLISPDDFRAKLDYTIGSIHFVGRFNDTHWEIDNTREVFHEGLTRIFDGNIRKAVTEYLRLTREMVLNSPPDIVGHLDKIKINAAPYDFSETAPWYKEEVEETIKAILTSGAIVEVNTRGIYKKKSSTTYPSPWILERILHAGIPVTISSDAHHPSELTQEFTSTTMLLQDLGFKNIRIFKDHTWKTIPLNEYGQIR
jgi:histidinol-phosphatase (PHP family)